MQDCSDRMTVPNTKSAKNRGFVYRPRKIRKFEKLTMRALHGEPEPLCEYLREGGLPRTHEDGNWLAFLLEKKLPRSRARPAEASRPVVRRSLLLLPPPTRVGVLEEAHPRDPRYGGQSITLLLRQEGWKANVKSIGPIDV